LLQINDSVFLDQRYLKTSRYLLESKNPLLVRILDSLEAGGVSIPVHVEDGWYILKLVNIWQNVVLTENEYLRLKQEASNAVFKKKMDLLSDKYVNELMFKNSPVIKRNPFNIVRSYLGKFYLSNDKYESWELEEKLNSALAGLPDDINNQVLVTFK